LIRLLYIRGHLIIQKVLGGHHLEEITKKVLHLNQIVINIYRIVYTAASRGAIASFFPFSGGRDTPSRSQGALIQQTGKQQQQQQGEQQCSLLEV